MTLTGDLLLAICLAYVVILFLVAALVDRAASEGRFRWLQSPVVYTLSISVYCTSWTFYGAVGSAARNGLEFITIYLGPTLVFVGWYWILRKLVRIGRAHRITSSVPIHSAIDWVMNKLDNMNANTPAAPMMKRIITLSRVESRNTAHNASKRNSL